MCWNWTVRTLRVGGYLLHQWYLAFFDEDIRANIALHVIEGPNNNFRARWWPTFNFVKRLMQTLDLARQIGI